ncbi:hypothetical protein RJ639_009680 [Escallonia herrerae]|uniref:Uncharacterized protein n=1 Tax=Escallonia herrerae TaxID=1293975 RepID=A0AA88VRU6_9ASTE|nr:hypothetical protein RJ639_009680 [Escallonia herrerae]
MVDGRSVMEQFNEIKSILDRYSQHKLALDEFIVVTSIIDKLPPSWKNFRNSLKHRKEDINLDELGTHLRIEEDLRKEEKSKSEDDMLIFGTDLEQVVKTKKFLFNKFEMKDMGVADTKANQVPLPCERVNKNLLSEGSLGCINVKENNKEKTNLLYNERLLSKT